MNENDLFSKLAISKKIMDIHNTKPRTQNTTNYNNDISVQEFNAPKSSYNIPQEYMSESAVRQQIPQNTNTKDKILQSKLPDEIKRLMIEHPIEQPKSAGSGSVLSDELIEKATRLMNNDIANNVNPYQPKKQQVQESSISHTTTSNLDKNVLKNIIRETIEEVLSENGLLVESTTKTNDVFQFRVGSHIFEGKVTKIKKVK
jgi:isochorismate synthase EntC